MGTFGTGILDNDTSGEVYHKFIEHLENGLKIPDIIKEINIQFIDYKNGDSKTDFLFALGLALWENCFLGDEKLEEIKSLIDLDIEIWKKLEGSEKDIKSRQRELKKFLKKIETTRTKPLKKQSRTKINKPPVFKTGACITFKLANGNYGGAIVIDELTLDTHEEASNTIISTNINQKEKPTKNDFLQANVLIVNHNHNKNWVCIHNYLSNSFYASKEKFEVINTIEVNLEIPKHFRKNFCGYSPWENLYEELERELAWEKPIRRKIKVISIKDILFDLKLKETRNHLQ